MAVAENIIKNKNCIRRLSRYKNALNRFKTLGFSRVFSNNLGDAVGVTAAQVRKDFSLFGITGNKRGGYQIDALLEELNIVLGKSKVQKVVIVGCGKIGTALMKYRAFEEEEIKIVAGFDIDPSKYQKAGAIPILSLEELEKFIKKNRIKIGIIAVPDIAAQETFDKMFNAGIEGVLNFAPIQLRAPEHVVINNVNLEHELESVIYFVHIAETIKK